MKIVLTLSFYFIILIVNAQENPIRVHNQYNYGYINFQGDTVLSFKYKNASFFSEGLACVREKGYFGYIDKTGEYILPPIYDYGENFEKGYAKVWIKGICYLIDKKGKPLFESQYVDLFWDREVNAIDVKTVTQFFGSVDINGTLIQDTIWNSFDDYREWQALKATKYFGSKYQIANKKYKKGIVTKDRKLIISPKYSSIEFATDSQIIVSSHSYNYFVINLEEEEVLDSTFSKIYKISDYALEVLNSNNGKWGILNFDFDTIFNTEYKYIRELSRHCLELVRPDDKIGLFNFNGDTIVPFGEYKDFGGGGDDYFLVKFLEEVDNETFLFGVIDKNGKFLKKWQLSDYEIFSKYLDDDIIIENEYIVVKRKMDGKFFYFNFIDGEFIPKRTKNYRDDDGLPIKYVNTPNKTHLHKQNGTYQLYKSNGTLVKNDIFKDYKIEEVSKEYGNFIVSSQSKNQFPQKWGVIDTLGKYLIPPIYSSIKRISDLKNLFTVKDSNKKRGVFSIEENKLIVPLGDYDNFWITSKNILIGKGDTVQYLFNTKGKLLWIEPLPYKKSKSPTIEKLNIDYQYKPWYAAGIGEFSKERKSKWFNLSLPQYAPDFKTHLHVPANQLSIIIDTSQIDTIDNQYFGHPMYIINYTFDTLVFAMQDMRLYVKIQALDENGQWRDIEYLFSSRCGNSYGIGWLQPNGLWEFSIPIYEGYFKTKLRMALITSQDRVFSKNQRYEPFYRKLKLNKEEWIYSEPFNGVINPAQFWRRLKPTDRFTNYRR